MEDKGKLEKLDSLNYEEFKKLAKDPKYSRYEKIGFPDSYRKGFEEKIFKDIVSKIKIKDFSNKKVIDIGCGCGDLVSMLINTCKSQNHQLFLLDSQEMLDQIPDNDNGYIKLPGYFPEIPDLLNKQANSFDFILCYSLLHYVFEEGNIYKFIDKACSLLNNGGVLLIGDIPNYTKRARFFLSAEGIAFHQSYVKDVHAIPNLKLYELDEKRIDDGVIFGIMLRYRNYGFETYLLPQSEDLPMSNRREDILIVKR